MHHRLNTRSALLCGTTVLVQVAFSLGVLAQVPEGGKSNDALRSPPDITGSKVVCAQGSAAGYPCSRVDLMSFVSLETLGAGTNIGANDIWGWTDSETGNEYALVGLSNAISFVDISDPVNPLVVGRLPTSTTTATQRDVKVYADHAFVVSEASNHGMQVFDLSRLRNATTTPALFTADTVYTRFGNAHNIVVNEETGFAFAVGTSTGDCPAGLHIIDVRSPRNPQYAGCFVDPDTGRSIVGYTHDAQCVIYGGPDTDHSGKELCFAANVTHISIADVTNKEAPVRISNATYPTASYVHQGWLSDDHRYFYQNDEADESNGSAATTRTLIWDLVDLDDPQLAGEYFSTFPSTDHNLYVRGSRLYQSNYTAGLRILDISNPTAPVETAFFDVFPANNLFGFNGSWSNYPYFDSGTIIVTERASGLYVLQESSESAASETEEAPDQLQILSAYPNPFRDTISIVVSGSPGQALTVQVYDLLGRRVQSFDRVMTGGVSTEIPLALRQLERGTYLVRIESRLSTKSVVVTKSY